MISIKEWAKDFLPPPLVGVIRSVRLNKQLYLAYLYDLKRFRQHSSSMDPFGSKQNLASRITESYHNVEKGLSLPTPRPGFGASMIQKLLAYLDRYIVTYGWDELCSASVAALVSYVEFNRGVGLSDEQIPSLVSILSMARRFEGILPPGGVREVEREDVLAAIGDVGIGFFESRSSVRQFADGAVSSTDIEFAARCAQKSPAVCNRQYSRLHVISDPSRIGAALEIQGGARGFSESIPNLAVITTDLRNFWGPGERMQPWTDGGLFAMSFILGLHARGVGSVCLNWSKTPEVDRAFRRVVEIPDQEVIIMLVGFGQLRDSYRVAMSPRVKLSETLDQT